MLYRSDTFGRVRRSDPLEGACTNTDGHLHLHLLAWAARYREVTFALEDCRHLTHGWSPTCCLRVSVWCVCRAGRWPARGEAPAARASPT
jgi:hypothetical protein